MSPKNLRLDCDRALECLLAVRQELAEKDSNFLSSHLAACACCSAQSQKIEDVVREMRSDVVYARPAMVRATQMRVRERAAEMKRQRETMRPLWISSALALGWAVVSMPLLWQGFAWLGHTTRLPDILWQTGFGIMVLMPITAVGTIGIVSRLNKATM